MKFIKYLLKWRWSWFEVLGVGVLSQLYAARTWPFWQYLLWVGGLMFISSVLRLWLLTEEERK